jgi:DNA-binding protein HU-beta
MGFFAFYIACFKECMYNYIHWKTNQRTNLKEDFLMNKNELIAAVAEKAETSKKDAEKMVNCFVSVVGDTLAKGEKVQLVGFGTFEVRQRAARKGLNPLTKQEIDIPASKAPAFKAGKALKDKVQ